MREIHIKKSHEGELHRELHVPLGKRIPEAKIEHAKHSSDPHVRAQATFAENAEHWAHRK